ncbi:MAG TPA: hypothetical protein EYG93_08260, partial [Sulfurospirillum arcachonense]|nr:hypothetical protein [Sulfurospirillum arcachonense]
MGIQPIMIVSKIAIIKQKGYPMANISLSGFTLAKGKELKGDDAFETKRMQDLSVALLCDGVGSAQEGQAAA